MDQPVIRIPLSTIIRLNLDQIRKLGMENTENLSGFLQDWTQACKVCGIPVMSKTYSEDPKWEEDNECDPLFTDVDLHDWKLGLVYKAKEREFLVLSVVLSKGKKEVYVALAKHFIFDVELEPSDYEELAQNIRGGWSEWMGILESRKIEDRIPYAP
ncbi:hypothetical protein KC725_04635 [Candidatus Peregrinibacteria bacterium]|nr:hypothetical protein [Candidatus Peregrinibacteria bacterium]